LFEREAPPSTPTTNKTDGEIGLEMTFAADGGWGPGAQDKEKGCATKARRVI